MGGLNFGRKYLMPKILPEGVSFIKKLNKWVVRIKRETKNSLGRRRVDIISIAAYKKKSDADKHYKQEKLKLWLELTK